MQQISQKTFYPVDTSTILTLLLEQEDQLFIIAISGNSCHLSYQKSQLFECFSQRCFTKFISGINIHTAPQQQFHYF
jgi:exoribonuclease II